MIAVRACARQALYTRPTRTRAKEPDLPLSLPTPAGRLAFPKELEEPFRDAYTRESLRTVRVGALLAAALYAAFGLLDPLTVPHIARAAWLMQYGVVCPVLLLSWAATFIPYFLQRLPRLLWPGIALNVLVAGGGIIVLSALTDGSDISALAYSGGVLVLVVMFSYTAARAPFLWAAGMNLVLFCGYLVSALAFQRVLDSPLGTVVFLSNTSILVGINFIGLFACYGLEYYARLDFMQRRTILKEQETSERLLLNILPREVADTLKKRGNPIARDYSEATLLFSDICGFTPLSSSMPPLKLLDLLNEVFSAFDEIVYRHGGEKIKTIGDCYMVTVGVPTPTTYHARIAARIALEMQDYLEQRANQGNGKPLRMRTGLHSGPVVAGVIGHRKFIYDLWGDTVNIASRMESHSLPGRIQITRATFERIKDAFDCEYRGTVNVKGKGEMETWFVNGEHPAAG